MYLWDDGQFLYKCVLPWVCDEKVYLPFINAFTPSLAFSRCSQLLLDLMLFILVVFRQSWAEPCGISGSSAKWLQQQKENGDKVVLANSYPFSAAFGLSWLVMVRSLACSEMMNMVGLQIEWSLDFLPVCTDHLAPSETGGLQGICQNLHHTAASCWGGCCPVPCWLVTNKLIFIETINVSMVETSLLAHWNCLISKNYKPV